MNVHDDKKVYKDFLTKPLNVVKYDDNKLTSKEEVHFITGSSIGYRVLKEECLDLPEKIFRTKGLINFVKSADFLK